MYKSNKRRLKGLDANIMTENQVKQTIERVIKYFLDNRNNLFEGQQNNFDENAIFIMLFENPGILCPGEDKKESVFSFLDNEEDIGIDAANRIAREHPGILTSHLRRTMTQVRIARDLGILDKFISNPKAFISAPKTTYALAMYAKGKANTEEEFQKLSISSIYIGRKPLLRNYGLTYEELYARYPLPDKYIITDEEIAKKDFRQRLAVDTSANTLIRENEEVVKEEIDKER